jgi:signal transduction histidine kinase
MKSSNTTNHDVTLLMPYFKDIAEAVMAAAASGNIETMLEQIAHVVRKLVNAKYAAIGIPDGRSHLRAFKYSGIALEDARSIVHPPIGRGLLGAVLNERTAIRLDNIQADKRSIGFPEHHPDMTSFLGAPIQIGNYLFGTLYLCDKLDGSDFDDFDQWLVETMASYAALAISGIHLSEQQSKLSIMEDRQRIAMELHDGVIQSLYAIGMQLQIFRMSPQIPDKDVAKIIHDLDIVIGEIRRYILNLKSTDHPRKSFPSQLSEIIERLHPPHEMTIHTHVEGDTSKLDSGITEAISQIVFEAASNAIRHGHPKQILITVKVVHGNLSISVEDDGIGFDPETTQMGLGLENIQRRTKLLGGSVEIVSADRVGTTIYVGIPL